MIPVSLLSLIPNVIVRYPLNTVGRVDMFRFAVHIVGIDHDSTLFFFLRHIQPVQSLSTIVTTILIFPRATFHSVGNNKP